MNRGSVVSGDIIGHWAYAVFKVHQVKKEV
jgi:hypothetical protein